MGTHLQSTELKLSNSENYLDRAEGYIQSVLSDTEGKTYCKWVRLAVARNERDRERERAGDWDYYFEPYWANDVCGFVELLPHVEGIWDSPTLVLEPWQVFLLTTVFGWRKKTGPQKLLTDPRRFNTAYVELARKNGKSALSSAVALYCLCCEGEVGPQVKTAATTGDQARIVFDVARQMVEKTPDLANHYGLRAMVNSIPCSDNGGHIKPINSKASTQDGLNPHCSIIDELHAHDDRSLFDVLKTARGARSNPISWYITTAGYNTHGVCFEQRTLVTKTLEGSVTADHYFGIIYTLDEKDNHLDTGCWIKANPNLRISVNFDEMFSFAEETKISPLSEEDFKTKRCNIWLSAAGAWLSMHQWDECGDDDLKIEDFAGLPAWMGVDLSQVSDMSAVVVLYYDDKIFYAFPYFYLPSGLVEDRSKKATPQYRVWANSGKLIVTPGDYINYNIIEEDIKRLCDMNTAAGSPVRRIVFDRQNAAPMALDLEENDYPKSQSGVDEVLVELVQKNAKTMSDPAKDLEARLRARLFKHNNHPILKWHAGNAVITRKVDGSILPKKETQESENKIDGIDALLNAMYAAKNYLDATSKYEEQGMTIVGGVEEEESWENI
jgi:phage terminase large subunit-like protein